MRHRPRVIARQQAAAHEDAQQPPAHAPLHFGEGWPHRARRRHENDPAHGVEHAVDDRAIEVQVEIEGGAEAVNLRDRAERAQEPTWSVRTQALLPRAQEHPRAAPWMAASPLQEG